MGKCGGHGLMSRGEFIEIEAMLGVDLGDELEWPYE